MTNSDKIEDMADDVYSTVRSNRKTLGLTIERDGTIVVRAPNSCPKEVIEEFVRSRKDWIMEKLDARREMLTKIPHKEFVDGEGFLYLGKSYRLKIVETGPPLRLYNGYFELNQELVSKGRDVFIDWYRSHALIEFKRRVEKYKRLLGVDPEGIRVLDLKYRWGSCSKGGTLNFHWKSVLAPLSMLDYIVVHELVHLKEKNHTPEFWKLVGMVLPDYERRKNWLEQNGPILDI